MKYTDEELLQYIIDCYEEDGIAPTSSDPRVPHRNVYSNRFGSWTSAVEQSGVPIRERTEHITTLCGYCDAAIRTTSARNQQFCDTTCSNKSRRIHENTHAPKLTRDEWIVELKKNSHEAMMQADFEALSWDLQRRRVLFEQNQACNKCGITHWMEVPLSLEVDHIDGDRTNNSRDNLEGLCPNCHSITETYKGRNRNSMQGKYTTEEKLLAYEQTENIHQALLLLGMAPKGANYANFKRVLEENNVALT